MPKLVDHDARRALILEACHELFARHGYGSVRMRQIAKESGVSIGALYHYFPDKESIGRQLFESASAHYAEQAAARIRPGMTRPERMEALSDFIEESREDLARILLLALDHHRLYPEGRDATVGALRTFKALLVGVMELPPEEADRLFSTLLGSVVRGVLDPSGMSPGVQLTD